MHFLWHGYYTALTYSTEFFWKLLIFFKHSMKALLYYRISTILECWIENEQLLKSCIAIVDYSSTEYCYRYRMSNGCRVIYSWRLYLYILFLAGLVSYIKCRTFIIFRLLWDVMFCTKYCRHCISKYIAHNTSALTHSVCTYSYN